MALVHDLILPMSELRLATNNFSEENLLKQTPSVVLYKGQLSDESGQSIPIVVRRYTNPEVSFNEAMISLFQIHKNMATLLKVASEELADDDDYSEELYDNTQMNVLSNGYHIYKYEVNESLDKHLSGSTLTWMQRLNICVEVARALCYLHHESADDSSFIHGNIKSSKILLNQNWEPTLNGLRADMIVKKHDVYHPNNYDGTLQYTDPAYEKTKGLSHKSDVYSFGVVLFEVLLGRVASIPLTDEDNWSFARFSRSRYERNKEQDDMMSADVARGHGGDGGSDDRPPPYRLPTVAGACLGKGTEKPNLGGRRAGRPSLTCVPTWFRFAGHKSMRGILAALQKDLQWQEGALKDRHWRPDADGTYDLEQIRLGRPSHISEADWDAHVAFWNDPKNLTWAAQNKQKNRAKRIRFYGRQGSGLLQALRDMHDEMLRLQGLGSNTSSGVPYTEDEIMAIVRRGKTARGHIPGVGRILQGSDDKFSQMLTQASVNLEYGGSAAGALRKSGAGYRSLGERGGGTKKKCRLFRCGLCRPGRENGESRKKQKLIAQVTIPGDIELRSQRPDMIQVVKTLERALEFQLKYETPEHSTTAAVEAPLSDQLKVLEKEIVFVLSI
ncbi:kinase RLK-Pelle-LRR-I-1 family protein [Tanacetum coccineum]